MAEGRFRLIDAAQGRPPIVVAVGDIDLANVEEFQAVMAMAAAGELTVDLSGVTYGDSAAVRALFEIAASTALTMVVDPDGPIRTLLGISGLDRVATVVAKE